MLRFYPQQRDYLGIFFVAKTDGTLRLISDTRIANTSFHPPPQNSVADRGGIFSYRVGGGGVVVCS